MDSEIKCKDKQTSPPLLFRLHFKVGISENFRLLSTVQQDSVQTSLGAFKREWSVS